MCHLRANLSCMRPIVLFSYWAWQSCRLKGVTLIYRLQLCLHLWMRSGEVGLGLWVHREWGKELHSSLCVCVWAGVVSEQSEVNNLTFFSAHTQFTDFKHNSLDIFFPLKKEAHPLTLTFKVFRFKDFFFFQIDSYGSLEIAEWV